MKGIVLAGGLATRLRPLTKVTNKHLLPIYNRPMIYYPIQNLVDAGIEQILILTGGNNAGDFLRLLGNGKKCGLKPTMSMVKVRTRPSEKSQEPSAVRCAGP